MKVIYDAKMREIAKRENMHLFAMAITHKGGKPEITTMGPLNEEDAKEVRDFILGFITRRAQRAKALSDRLVGLTRS